MNETLRALSGNLYAIVSLYLLFTFSRLLWKNGRDWVLYWFCLSIMIIVGSIALQRGWAAGALVFSEPGTEYNPFFNNWRWLVNFIAAPVFVVGAFIFESQLIDGKDNFKQIAIYTCLIFSAIVLSI